LRTLYRETGAIAIALDCARFLVSIVASLRC
jgi:hypothetical protein